MNEIKLRESRIRNKLKLIKDTVLKVKFKLPSSLDEFEKLDFVKDGIYKRTEFALQLEMDICDIINADFSLGIPETENTVIENLRKNSIISKELANKLIKMKGFRNALVHRYEEIDDNKAFVSLKTGLGDFDIFISEIEKFLEKHKSDKKQKHLSKNKGKKINGKTIENGKKTI